MWKPGQLVTIHDKVFRVTKDTGDRVCDVCDYKNTFYPHEPCYTCLYGYKMPFDCYLKEIKPKSVMG